MHFNPLGKVNDEWIKELCMNFETTKKMVHVVHNLDIKRLEQLKRIRSYHTLYLPNHEHKQEVTKFWREMNGKGKEKKTLKEVGKKRKGKTILCNHQTKYTAYQGCLLFTYKLQTTVNVFMNLVLNQYITPKILALSYLCHKDRHWFSIRLKG